MSKTEIQKVLTVDTKNSQATVKALKDEILKLNAELQNANTNSSKLQTSTSQLGDALDNSAGDAKQLDTSYNSLVNTMKNLKKEWRATTDEMERNNLGGKIIEVNSKLKEMDATIGNFQRNVGNYPKTFGQQMSEVGEAIQPTVSRFDAIQKTAAGLTSGIAALTGTMALLGIENEDVQKSLLKVQSAMAIAQGVGGLKDLVEGLAKGKAAFGGLTSGIGTSIKSLGMFKIVLAGLGISAGIAALGALGYAFAQMFNATENAKKGIEGANKQMEEMLKTFGLTSQNGTLQALQEYIIKLNEAYGSQDKLNKAVKWYNDEQKRLAKETLQNEIFALDTRKQSLDTQLLDAQERLRKSQKTQTELNNSSFGGRESRMSGGITNLVQSKVVETNNEAIKKLQDELQTVDGLLKDKQIKLKELEAETIKSDIEGNLKTIETIKTAQDDKYTSYIEKLKEAIELKEKELALQEEERKKALAKDKEKLTSIDNVESQNLYDSNISFQAKELYANEFDLINLKIDALNEERRIRQQAHLERMMQYDEILEKETLTVEESIALEKEKEKVAFEFYNEEKKLSVQTLKLQQQQSAQEIALKELTEEAKLDIANMFFAAGEKFAAENWYISRGFASAQAIVDTYKAANAAYAAMAGIPVVGPALGAAASAAAIAMGLANVHQIWQVDESGKEPTTTSSTMAAATPSFNLADSLPVQYSRNILTDRELDEINKPTKVYLVESELRDFQNRVEIRESNSTF